MAEFLQTEAIDVDAINDDNDNNEGNTDTATVSDDEFIDDRPQNENNDFYPYFTNVSKNYDDAMRDFQNVDDLEARNYFDSDEEEEEINDFFKTKVKLFKESLINPQGSENPDSFFYCILYAIRNKLIKKVDCIDDKNLKKDVGLALSHDLFQIKSLLRLDLDVLNFENQCFKINTILTKYNMFLRVFGDFIIKKEHMFLKNIFSKEQLLKSLPISTFESFKKHFIEFLEIVIKTLW